MQGFIETKNIDSRLMEFMIRVKETKGQKSKEEIKAKRNPRSDLN